MKMMGIDVWVSRDQADAASVDIEGGKSDQHIQVLDESDWESLKREVSQCTRCELHRGRTQTVFGCGATISDWMLIGEAPGAEEDRKGEPFVGRAGRLLTSMLQAVGLHRDEVFIANILKCRPPQNRDPAAGEVEACEEYLKRQIMFIRPKIILALGRIAAQNLLKMDIPISRMRGKIYEYGEQNIPLIVSYHPAYLLRSPREKRKSWQDLQLAMQLYNGL
jgi:DNA polymerase